MMASSEENERSPKLKEDKYWSSRPSPAWSISRRRRMVQILPPVAIQMCWQSKSGLVFIFSVNVKLYWSRILFTAQIKDMCGIQAKYNNFKGCLRNIKIFEKPNPFIGILYICYKCYTILQLNPRVSESLELKSKMSPSQLLHISGTCQVIGSF